MVSFTAMLKKVWIIPVWGLATTLFAHAFGYAGKVRNIRYGHQPAR